MYLRIQLLGAKKVGELGLAVHRRVARDGHVLRAASHALSPLGGLDDLLLHTVRQGRDDLRTPKTTPEQNRPRRNDT